MLSELRVSTDQSVVVPPFGCAWLQSEAHRLSSKGGCLELEAKGEWDITIVYAPAAGAKRWQHEVLRGSYTLILGSHRNSFAKLEKDNLARARAQLPQPARPSKQVFRPYWVNYHQGQFMVGAGSPGEGLFLIWQDPEPLEDIQYIGLSAWDKHVSYRHISLHAALPNSTCGDQQLRQGRNELQKGPTMRPGEKDHGSRVQSLIVLSSTQFVASASPSNVCQGLAVVEMLSPVADFIRPALMELLIAGLAEILQHQAASFCQLGEEIIQDLLSSNLQAVTELQLLDALLLWAGKAASSPSASEARPLYIAEALMHLVRFPLMAEADLQALAKRNLAEESPVFRRLLDEAVLMRGKVQALGSESLKIQKRHIRALTADEAAAAARFVPRVPYGAQPLTYEYDGDQNGVIHHFGTCFGTQQWVNPVLAGRIQVQASSPSCRSTDPKILAGGGFQRINFAGPRRQADGSHVAWWAVHLGPHHRLACRHVTLRHDGTQEFLRTWTLQASNDAASWVDLLLVKDDHRLKLPGQFASWPILAHASADAFGSFRILISSTAGGLLPTVHLSHLELYGYLFCNQQSATCDQP